ncbi:MAG: hypothetical protein ABR954_05880 [Dehalococcoidales bacterium]
MWNKVRHFFERYRRWSMSILFIIIVALWLSRPFQEQLPFEAVIGITTSTILLFMFLVLDYLIALTKPNGLQIYPDDYHATNRLVDFVINEGTQKAKMIEYSGATVAETLIRVLRNSPNTNEINLLICHPEKAISPYEQNQRICYQIKRLPDIVGKYDRLKVKCYKEFASIRGRKFDNRLIAIGWYTYDTKEERVKSLGDEQIWGAENPVMITDLRGEGKHIGEMFDRVYESLWNRAIPLREVCNSCKGRDLCIGRPSDEWLTIVSPS